MSLPATIERRSFLALKLFSSFSKKSVNLIESKAVIMPQEQWKAYKVRILWSSVENPVIYDFLQAEYGKFYPEDEDAKRYIIFEENWKVISTHNLKYKRGEVSYSMGLNQFSDWIPFTWAEPNTAVKPVTVIKPGVK